MNRGRRSAGFTIIETLIFLAVTGTMLIGMAVLISGKQGKTEFTTSARNFEVTIQDIANDVSTGFFSDAGNGSVTCTSSLVISTGAANQQGRNKDCIFIGKSIQMTGEDYTLQTLAGKRLHSGEPVENLTESGIAIVGPLTETKRIGRAIQLGCIFYLDAGSPSATSPCAGAPNKTNKISFFTTFVPRADSDTNSRFIRSDIVVQAGFASADTYNKDTPANPAGGVFICLNSTASEQYALLQIGGQASGSTTSTTINQGLCG